MKIRIVNRSKHNIPSYSTEASSGIDLRANIEKGINMKSEILYIFLILTGIYYMAGCGKNLSPSISALTRGKGFDYAEFEYVYIEAVKQKLMGNNGDALKHLERCAEINPKSDAVYYQMAQIFMTVGDINSSKKYITKAIELEPGNIWYMKMLAGIHYQNQNLDSAIIYYEKAVKSFPEKVDLKLTLGSLYSDNQKFDKADAIFDNLDKKYGTNEASTLANVKNQMRAEKYDKALELIMKLLKDKPDEILYNGLLAEIYRGKGQNNEAMNVYNRLIERNPDSPETQLSLCDFLLNEKKYEELMQLLNTVVLNKSIPREEKISLFAGMIENTDLVKKNGKSLQLSIMILEGVYKEDEIIMMLRPELFIKDNKLKEAAARLEEIIEESPGYYFAWEKLLIVLLQAGDYRSLEVRGKECASRFNRSFIAKMLYASAATENRKYEIALEEVRKAEILAGNNKDMIMQVLSVRADIYYRMENYSKAFEIFDEAIKTDNTDLTILNNYAYYLAEQNLNLKEAEKMAKQVIEKEKENRTFLDTYGWVLYKRGKVKEAEKIMRFIISSNEKPDAEWYEHMGYIQKKRRDCRKAVENWNIALKLDSTKSVLLEEIIKCQNER